MTGISMSATAMGRAPVRFIASSVEEYANACRDRNRCMLKTVPPSHKAVLGEEHIREFP